jgi:hypothetical protein
LVDEVAKGLARLREACDDANPAANP